MFITGTWQRRSRCFLIAITDPPGFCSACTLPTAQGQGQKDQLFFSSPDPIVRPSVQLYSLDLINSELFRWGGPLPCRLLFFSAAKGGGISWKTCESGAVNNIDFGSHRAFHSGHLYSESLSYNRHRPRTNKFTSEKLNTWKNINKLIMRFSLSSRVRSFFQQLVIL